MEDGSNRMRYDRSYYLLLEKEKRKKGRNCVIILKSVCVSFYWLMDFVSFKSYIIFFKKTNEMACTQNV